MAISQLKEICFFGNNYFWLLQTTISISFVEHKKIQILHCKDLNLNCQKHTKFLRNIQNNRNCKIDYNKQKYQTREHKYGNYFQSFSDLQQDCFLVRIFMSPGQMLPENMEEEDTEGEGETKDEPDIYQLDIGCWGQLV